MIRQTSRLAACEGAAPASSWWHTLVKVDRCFEFSLPLSGRHLLKKKISTSLQTQGYRAHLGGCEMAKEYEVNTSWLNSYQAPDTMS